MRLVFAGTPEFSNVALQHLIKAGHEIVLVLTQPDRPAGRGLKLQASPVKGTALAYNIPVSQPRSLRLDGKFSDDAQQAKGLLQEAVHTHGAQAMVVAAYGLILPEWVLTLPPLGCLNIHASLLPRWRGAAPIHRAIEAGDTQTGITIMQMDQGLDTGAMLLAESLPISPVDTTGTLHDKLAEQGARLCCAVLQNAITQPYKATAQPVMGITYAAKITKAEAQINWYDPAELISRRVRAFNPAPGAWSNLAGEVIKVWQAWPINAGTATETLLNRPVSPGTVVQAGPDGVIVTTGRGCLQLSELQRAGSKRMPLAAFLNGKPVLACDFFCFAEPDADL